MPSEGREIINHQAILLVVVVAAIGAAVVVGLLAFQQKASSPPQSQVLNQTSMSQPRGGHLYMQTNVTRNAIVGTTFDELPTRKNPDGSLILWIPRRDGKLHVIASNAPDPDGLVVFPVGGDGTLSAPSLYDAKGISPFYIAFLHNRPDTFIIGYAISDGVAMGRIDAGGKINVISPLVQINTNAGLPSELCWLAVSPDDRFVFTTNFGYSTVSSFRIDGNALSIAKDPAGPKVPGDGTFRAINGTVGSGPSDSWLAPDGAYLYEIYGNASKLVGYATQPDGSLKEITSATIPYNSPQGLAGF